MVLCQWDLVRAVRATNRFDFGEATAILLPWIDGKILLPAAEPQHQGRLASTLGQHSAFVAHKIYDPKDADKTRRTADEFFLSALSTFQDDIGPMSQSDARREMCQTGVYWAINGLGYCELSAHGRRARVQRVLTWHRDIAEIPDVHGELAGEDDLPKTLIEAIVESDDSGSRYPHHLLVRFLAEMGTSSEKEIYRKALLPHLYPKSDVNERYGHPLELIRFYQSLILDADEQKDLSAACLESSIKLAFDERSGPTVNIIGLVIELATRAKRKSNDKLQHRAQELEEPVREKLPQAQTTFDLLRQHRDSPAVDTLTFVQAALPFNFR